MINKSKSSPKMMKLLHKFNRYNKREKWFAIYLIVLLLSLLFFPIIEVTSLRGTGGYSVWIRKGELFKTMVIVLASMGILLGRNFSFRFKNIFLSYFGGRENDSLINFLFLFIITTSFFAITDTIGVSSGITSRVVVAWGGKFIQFLLLIGIVMTFISLLKAAKEVGKKTKIINMVDGSDEKEDTKKDIKKGLFDK